MRHLLTFIMLVLCIAAAYFVYHNYFTGRQEGEVAGVETRVLAKHLKEGVVLVTISGEQGASVISFTQKADEINMLVDPGDYLTLELGAYSPFVLDPAIVRVRKHNVEQLLKNIENPPQPVVAPSAVANAPAH